MFASYCFCLSVVQYITYWIEQSFTKLLNLKVILPVCNSIRLIIIVIKIVNFYNETRVACNILSADGCVMA
jgi:hypothetical protein